MISGDDDTTRLRILADQHNYQAGDAARVNLHWREAPALALVTYEGASILGHKLVELKTGANPFDFAIEPRLGPEFRARRRRDRPHAAPWRVQRFFRRAEADDRAQAEQRHAEAGQSADGRHYGDRSARKTGRRRIVAGNGAAQPARPVRSQAAVVSISSSSGPSARPSMRTMAQLHVSLSAEDTRYQRGLAGGRGSRCDSRSRKSGEWVARFRVRDRQWRRYGHGRLAGCCRVARPTLL